MLKPMLLLWNKPEQCIRGPDSRLIGPYSMSCGEACSPACVPLT